MNLCNGEGIVYRQEVTVSDAVFVRDIVESTGYFSSAEVGIAVELVEERLVKGTQSGYFFLFAGEADRVIGYTCFGPIPGSLYSYDIYWIAVRRNYQRMGLGGRLLSFSESLIAEAGGRKIFIDTSSRPQYETTRRFYERYGYSQAALIEDFYGPDDGKIIYAKNIPATREYNPRLVS